VRHRRLMAGMISLSIAVSGLVVTPAHAAPSQDDGIFVVTFGDQTIEYGIARHAATDPAYRASAQDLTRSWIDQLDATGSPIPGLTGQDASTQLANITKLNSDLTAGNLPQTELTSKDGQLDSTGPQSSTSDSGVIGPKAEGGNPNSFPVRGAPGGSRLYWTGMSLIIAGRFCGPSGCSADTDRITSRVTVDPGARTTRFSSTNLYAPNSGAFGDRHLQLWAINRGAIVGKNDTQGLPAAASITSPVAGT
jgi:hypothetical protein